MLCANCSKKIYFKYDEHYRCCDEDVCSERCALARVKYVSSYDPELSSPLEWKDLNAYPSDPKNIFGFGKPTLYGMRSCKSSYSLPTIDEDAEHQVEPQRPPTLMTILLVMFLLRVVFA